MRVSFDVRASHKLVFGFEVLVSGIHTLVVNIPFFYSSSLQLLALTHSTTCLVFIRYMALGVLIPLFDRSVAVSDLKKMALDANIYCTHMAIAVAG